MQLLDVYKRQSVSHARLLSVGLNCAYGARPLMPYLARLAALAEKTALDAGIPFQLTVRRSGGTDAAALHLSGKGVPSIVLGIPTRYIHAHNGVLDLRDYRAAVELTVALARSLDQEAVEALTHYLP